MELFITLIEKFEKQALQIIVAQLALGFIYPRSMFDLHFQLQSLCLSLFIRWQYLTMYDASVFY